VERHQIVSCGIEKIKYIAEINDFFTLEIFQMPEYAIILPDDLLANAKVVAQRNSILPSLPKGKVFAEIGVALGDFSEIVLKTCEPSKFIAIDHFSLHGAPQMWGGKVGEALGDREHLDFIKDRFREEIGCGKFVTMQGDSVKMLSLLDDASIDIFYVDANHSYDSVKAELDVIKHKVADGGWIILNDYIMADWLTNDPYGVVQATNEFMVREGWEMRFFALHTGMFCDVALTKVR
jgi:hypothetical protein